MQLGPKLYRATSVEYFSLLFPVWEQENAKMQWKIELGKIHLIDFFFLGLSTLGPSSQTRGLVGNRGGGCTEQPMSSWGQLGNLASS